MNKKVINILEHTPGNHFNVDVAIDHSPNVSIWITYLKEITEINLAKKRNIHDGLVWFCASIRDLAKLFPYLTKSQLETIINKSVKSGLVVKGNYNKHPHDKTCWYALTKKSYSYFTDMNQELL